MRWKSECRNPKRRLPTIECLLRNSEFGFLSDFGFRTSDFEMSSLRPPRLCVKKSREIFHLANRLPGGMLIPVSTSL
jgi:hypothetical protein